MSPVALDSQQFKAISTRNTMLPMALALLLSAIFISLILMLLSNTKQVDHSNQVISKVQSAFLMTIDGETGLRGFVITNKEKFLEPYQLSIEKAPWELEQVKQLVLDNPAQVARIDEILKTRVSWEEYANDLINHARSQTQKRDVVTSERGKVMMDSMRKTYRAFISQEEYLRDQRVESTQQTTRMALALTIIGSLLVGGFLAFYSRKQLKLVADTYGDALFKQAEQAEVLGKQAWLRTAQGQMVERVRGEQELEEVSQGILDLVCDHLDAKVGALYLVQESGDLELVASHGMSAEETRLNFTLPAGSTLASKAVQSRKVVRLDPAPQEHLKIHTALGSSQPSSVLIAPSISDQKVKAVVELGFLRSLQDRDLEFLEFLSESIGVSISSAQYRARLRELLEESQRQSEELQTQQEELRVNNEELEEQTKALKESQSRLETQQAELEQTNSQLSMQATTLERQNDDLSAARRALENKAAEIERASQYKSQFLANMSHELRTPLNSTLILAQLLIDNKGNRLTREEVEYARTILTSSNDLLALINEILDLAKVESGTIQLHPERVSVKELLEGLQKVFKPMAESKNLSFRMNDANAAKEIFVDRQRLEQILKNLLSNALKFTQNGGVILEVSSQGDYTVLKVSDTGIGIPESQQGLIFEAFQQADGTTSRQFGGTGLGLTISRDLSKLLGGEISVSSQVGKGSSFTLRIPTNFSIHAEPMVLKKPEVLEKTVSKKNIRNSAFKDDRHQLDQSLRILMVVEDDDVFAKILYDLSHEHQFQTLVAQTAEDAVDLAEEFIPHAIILDMQLPDHNGLFVLEHLKNNPKTRHIPVHVISAVDYADSALNMGAIGYLMKPSPKEEVSKVIQKLEFKLSQDFKRVLIVEDNDVQREGIKKLLSEPGVEVHTAETGRKALDVLFSSAVDCVILDLKLPDMTGFEVLEKLKEQKINNPPPVIIYTARSLTKDEEAKLQQYSETIILKGAKSPERLLSEVSLFLHQVESRMAPERQKVLQDLRDREKTLEGRTILLVDDDVRNIFALSNALQSKGAKIEIARNGKESIQKLDTLSNVDLVLMDIMMPEMDGYEAMRLIRKNPKHRKLPIIAITAKAMSDDQEKCIEAGASDYLAKPIELPKLISLIKVWLQPLRKTQQ